MKKNLVLLVVVFAVFFSWSNVSHAQCVFPSVDFSQCFRTSVTQNGQGYIARDVLGILENIGGFLLVASGIIAGIVIIVAGVLYMGAGSNSARVATAKAVFKNGLIGALIFFAAGVIVNTIALIALDPFGFFS